jgi:hypothetical protein
MSSAVSQAAGFVIPQTFASASQGCNSRTAQLEFSAHSDSDRSVQPPWPDLSSPSPHATKIKVTMMICALRTENTPFKIRTDLTSGAIGVVVASITQKNEQRRGFGHCLDIA